MTCRFLAYGPGSLTIGSEAEPRTHRLNLMCARAILVSRGSSAAAFVSRFRKCPLTLAP